MTPVVFGCMDSEAVNYNIDVNTDDGSCQYYLINIIATNIGGSTYEFELDVYSMEGYTVYWNFGDESYSNEEAVIHTYLFNGEYVITVTVSNGSMALVDELTIVVDVPGLALDEFEDKLISEYFIDLLGKHVEIPNSNQVYIQVQEFQSGKAIRQKTFFKF